MLKYFILLFVSTSIFAGTVGTPYSPPSLTGTVTSTNFVGNASGLTNLNASALVGTVPDAQLPNSRIGFVGDSLSAPERGWSTTLLNRYLPDFSGTNVAVSGETTFQMLTQINGITNWLARTSPSQQRYVWVLGGYNDVGKGTNLAATIANLQSIYHDVTNVGARLIVGTLWGGSILDPLNTWIRSNHTSYGAILLDLAQVMDPSQGMTFDGLHPNDLGGNYIAGNIAAALGRNSPVWSSVTAGTNRQYAGSVQAFQLAVGTGGKTNLVLRTDGGVEFPNQIYSNVGINGNVQINGFGPNLVTNGTFDANTNEWRAVSQGTIAVVPNGVDGNCLQLTQTGANGQTYLCTVSGFTTEVGTRYVFSCWYNITNAGDSLVIKLGDDYNSTSVLTSEQLYPTVGWHSFTTNFTGVAPTLYITFYGYTDSKSMLFDSVLVATDNASTLWAGKINARSMEVGNIPSITANTNGDVGINTAPNAYYGLAVGSGRLGTGSISANGLVNINGNLLLPGAGNNATIGGTLTATNGYYVSNGVQIATSTGLVASALVGTVPDERLSTNVVTKTGTNVFSGTNTFNGVTVMNGNVGIGTITPTNATFEVNGSGYFKGDVTCSNVVDLSSSPDSLEDALAIVSSIETVNGKVDHAKLSPLAWGTKEIGNGTFTTNTTKTVIPAVTNLVDEIVGSITNKVPQIVGSKTNITTTVTEGKVAVPDQSKRSLSMVVSAQALVIKDLLKRIEALETRVNKLEGK